MIKSSDGRLVSIPEQSLKVIIGQNSPSCPHGPTLLFEHRSSKERFYACSACRDRKDCNFFLREGKTLSEAAALALDKRKSSFTPDKSFTQLHNQLLQFTPDQFFCHSCTCLVDASCVNTAHRGHNVQGNITKQLLEKPTKLLHPLQNNSKEAQFFFSNPSVKFLLKTLSSLKSSRVICVGTPSLVELLQDSVPVMLLDFDWRYGMFFGDRFCWYNMFNHHFFDSKDCPGSESKSRFTRFLQSAPTGGSYVIVMDPPFGGRAEALAQTLKSLASEIRGLSRSDNIYYLWVYPYFMEPFICAELPDAKMLDYKITYINHRSLKPDSNQILKLGSPVRVFTNAPTNLIEMPVDEGYRFCSECQRYVAHENKHCSFCKSCTSKNGKTYVHCKICKRCVKPTWKHCKLCSRCCLPQHMCQGRKKKINTV